MRVGQCPRRHVWGGNVQAAVALPTALAIPRLGLLTLPPPVYNPPDDTREKPVPVEYTLTRT